MIDQNGNLVMPRTPSSFGAPAAVPPPAPALGLSVGGNLAGTAQGPFANLQPGQTANYRSFTANQFGAPGAGMTVIAGHGSPFGMIDQYIHQGVAPQTAAQIAQAGYIGKLEDVKSGLLPATTAADIAKTQADTSLLGEQAKYYGTTARAQAAANYGAAASGAGAGAMSQANAAGNRIVNDWWVNHPEAVGQAVGVTPAAPASPTPAPKAAAPAAQKLGHNDTVPGAGLVDDTAARLAGIRTMLLGMG